MEIVRLEHNDKDLDYGFPLQRVSIFATNHTHLNAAPEVVATYGSSTFFFRISYDDLDTFGSVSAGFQKLGMTYPMIAF